MKRYYDIFQLLDDICKIKYKVIRLPYKSVIQFRKNLYEIGFAEWVIDLLWDYVWDYRTYYQVKDIFEEKKKIIKRYRIRNENNENKNRL